MMSQPQFFTLIIGTEILNRRREDKHFDFVTRTLANKGAKLTGSFIIEDDPALIVQTIKFIASQPNPVLFSFGGIGSTPDDHTRKCAAIALRNGKLYEHPEAKKIIEEKLGKEAYPHPIKMAQLPKGAELLDNPVNKMPAFSLDERYFFMPGFPEMSHPMVEEIVAKLLPESKPYYRYTLTALCKENELIEVMEQMPKEVEFSSLPKLYTDGWRVSISVASHDEEKAKEAFQRYIDLLEKKQIRYGLNDEA
ncbi:competence/damage-inducible protein A [Sulfurovum sp. NBC37-1]|uniref:competence/damage-inducible protein A n=1 Tax=Sulfurovum sp. (strain NBC37-1) TaxID=387093 RepID=UPI0001587DB8|nr:molybdopterin-binding protein [Sulfurovum sp. NBC37-1]BAF72658.1 molybdenum cofactor biosynthesis protein [Sulfurovum sp. NBC37-1]